MTENQRLPLIDETAIEPEDPAWYMQRMYDQIHDDGEIAGNRQAAADGKARA